MFRDKLQALLVCRPTHKVHLSLELGEITTPLKVHVLEQELQNHPDKQYVNYILTGIKHGFRLGFNYSASKLIDSNSNLLSAVEHPGVINDYLANELENHRMAVVPKAVLSEAAWHISPFG